MHWVEKYKPRSLKEVKIDSNKLALLKKLILDKKPVMIYGNTGVGKTCCIYALANELNYEVIEVSASDLRNKENINSIIGQASTQESLFKSGKILLIDEVDALTKIDRGGAVTILKIISGSKFSVVLTANDAYHSNLGSIRRKCKLIEFDDVRIYDILDILKKILRKEEVKYTDGLLMEIAKQSKGDVRAAISDLQVNALGNKKIGELYLGGRERKEDIFKILREIFKKKNVAGIADKLNIDYDELILWLEENLPKEYFGKALVKGFGVLSKADIFRERIKRQQYWRYLVYIRDLITAGIAVSKENISDRFVSYKRNRRILKYWIAKQKNLKKKEIASKLAKRLHTSNKKILKDFYFYEKINSKFQVF